MSVELDFLRHVIEVVFVGVSESSQSLLLLEELNLNDAADSA
jgi:hypothetical protein